MASLGMAFRLVRLLSISSPDEQQGPAVEYLLNCDIEVEPRQNHMCSLWSWQVLKQRDPRTRRDF